MSLGLMFTSAYGLLFKKQPIFVHCHPPTRSGHSFKTQASMETTVFCSFSNSVNSVISGNKKIYIFFFLSGFRVFSPDIVPAVPALLPGLHASNPGGWPTGWFACSGKRHSGSFWECQPGYVRHHRSVSDMFCMHRILYEWSTDWTNTLGCIHHVCNHCWAQLWYLILLKRDMYAGNFVSWFNLLGLNIFPW